MIFMQSISKFKCLSSTFSNLKLKSTQVDDDAMTSCEVYCKNDWDPVSDRCGSISPFIVDHLLPFPSRRNSCLADNCADGSIHGRTMRGAIYSLVPHIHVPSGHYINCLHPK